MSSPTARHKAWRAPALAVIAMALVATACSSPAAEEPPEAIPSPIVATAPPAGADDRPNIVFILVDNMRALDLELGFGRSLDDWDSQLVERFVDEGTTFESFFNTTPLCCPSRVSYLTGRYAHNHSVYANGYDSCEGNGGWRRWWEQGYEEENVGTWLQQAGYTTALVGKFLNGYPNDPGFFVSEAHVPPGWDEFYSTHIETSVFSYYDFVMTENGELARYGPEQNAYLTDIERGHAVDFVRSAASQDEPFFLFLNPYAPHAPSEAAPRHEGMHEQVTVDAPPSFNEADLGDKPAHIREGATERVRFFGGGARRRLDMTLALDELIGALFAELEATGQLDNTYVFLASDNGITVGEHSTGGKSTPYEEAIRIPMLMRGPGATNQHLVGNIDIAPTLLELAGVRAPDWVDGESILGLIDGGSGDDWRDGILIELRHPVDSPNQSGIIPRYFGVRTADYLYAEYETGERELYDLASDPWQIDSVHDSAGDDIIAPLAALIAGLRGCSGDGCRLGARFALEDCRRCTIAVSSPCASLMPSGRSAGKQLFRTGGTSVTVRPQQDRSWPTPMRHRDSTPCS